MKNATFDKRQKLANLLIDSVTLYLNKAVVKGNIPLVSDYALGTANLSSMDTMRKIQFSIDICF